MANVHCTSVPLGVAPVGSLCTPAVKWRRPAAIATDTLATESQNSEVDACGAEPHDGLRWTQHVASVAAASSTA